MICNNTTKIRILYKHIDKMNNVYYGNYAEFYEIGRIELLRSKKIIYADIEKKNMIMPVVDMYSKFIKSPLYDDIIYIKTKIENIFSDIRIKFIYEIYNEKQEKINYGYTTICCINTLSNKIIKFPNDIIIKLKS